MISITTLPIVDDYIIDINYKRCVYTQPWLSISILVWPWSNQIHDRSLSKLIRWNRLFRWPTTAINYTAFIFYKLDNIRMILIYINQLFPKKGEGSRSPPLGCATGHKPARGPAFWYSFTCRTRTWSGASDYDLRGKRDVAWSSQTDARDLVVYRRMASLIDHVLSGSAGTRLDTQPRVA